MKKLILVIFFITVFIGCGHYTNDYIFYNFEKDSVMVANVGDEMLNWTEVTKNDKYGIILSSFAQSLTYSGKEGNVIKVFYREAANNLPRPSYTQELTYDLTDEKTITFRQTKIKIVEVTNNQIKYIVLQSPMFQFKSGEKINKVAVPTQKSKIKDFNVMAILAPPRPATIETKSQGTQKVKVIGESNDAYKIIFPNDSTIVIRKDSVISIKYLK